MQVDLREMNSLELEVNSGTKLETKKKPQQKKIFLVSCNAVAKIQWQSFGANDVEVTLVPSS